MATTDTKALNFFNIACDVARTLVRAYYLASQGKDLHGSLDMATWLSGADEGTNGNITGLEFSKAEATEAMTDIDQFIAWMEEDLGDGEARLSRLSRMMKSEQFHIF